MKPSKSFQHPVPPRKENIPPSGGQQQSRQQTSSSPRAPLGPTSQSGPQLPLPPHLRRKPASSSSADQQLEAKNDLEKLAKFNKLLVIPLQNLAGPYVDNEELKHRKIEYEGRMRFDDGDASGRQVFLTPVTNEQMRFALARNNTPGWEFGCDKVFDHVFLSRN